MQSFDDIAGDLVLNDEDVFELSVVGFGPEIEAVLHFDELGTDPKLIAGFADTALENVVDTETLPDLLDAECAAIDLGQCADQLLGEAIGEVLVVGIAAQVVERQDRYRRHLRLGCHQGGAIGLLGRGIRSFGCRTTPASDPPTDCQNQQGSGGDPRPESRAWLGFGLCRRRCHSGDATTRRRHPGVDFAP